MHKGDVFCLAVVWMRPKEALAAPVDQDITLGLLAEFASDDSELERSLRGTVMLRGIREGRGVRVVSALDMVRAVRTLDQSADVRIIGPDTTVVRPHLQQSRGRSTVMAIGVAVLLFFGAMLAIMFFHADVEMGVVHQGLYQMVTGQEIERPLILQIPYSIGVGLGVLLFFNSLSSRQPSSDPSPLDIQMYAYDKGTADYLASEDTPRPGPMRNEETET